MRKLAGIAAGGAVLTAALVSGLIHPWIAMVTVELPPRVVTSTGTVTGSRGSDYLSTRQVNVSITDTLRVPTSAAEVATYATGQVVFVHFSACTKLCGAGMNMLPAGYELLSRSGAAYRTVADVWWKEGTVSAPVGIRAEIPGPAGNSGPHTIFETRLWPGWMVPDNPGPITGGTSRMTHKVAQSDLDAALSTLHDRLATELPNATNVNASGLVYRLDGPARYTYATDRGVGDETPVLTVTMTASVSLNGFSDARARELVSWGVPPHLGPVWTSYVIDTLSPNGDVRLRSYAAAFTIVATDTSGWQRRLASMSVADARSELLRAFPGAEVDVKAFGAPSLPASPDRIRLVFEPLPSYPA